jgi:hypothetical protein
MAATFFKQKAQDHYLVSHENLTALNALGATVHLSLPSGFGFRNYYTNLTVGGCGVMICALPYGVLSCFMLKSPYVYVSLIFVS